MLAYRPRAPSRQEAQVLRSQSAMITSAPSYSDRLLAAARWTPSRLGTLVAKLHAALPRGDRCVYCEDSRGTDVDHVRPKTLHPDLTYAWHNLVPACGTCNSPRHKGQRDAILAAGTGVGWVEITRARTTKSTTAVLPPPSGRTAWLNPRLFNPLADLKLDIVGQTFYFENVAPPGSDSQARAHWTLERLKLNDRDDVVEARRVAFSDYVRWLRAAIEADARGDGVALSRQRNELRHMNHPTVWAELKRQRTDLPDVDKLLHDLPQVLTW